MADIVDKPADPYTSECKVVTSAAVGLTTANYHPTTGLFRGMWARVAYMGVEGNIRFHVTGTTPSTNCGMVLLSSTFLMLDSPTAIENFKAMATGTATLYITYFA